MTLSDLSAVCFRVDSDVNLSDLRSDLGTFLGLDRIADRYVFLKCVGRSLALVSSYHCRIIYKLVTLVYNQRLEFVYLFIYCITPNQAPSVTMMMMSMMIKSLIRHRT